MLAGPTLTHFVVFITFLAHIMWCYAIIFRMIDTELKVMKQLLYDWNFWIGIVQRILQFQAAITRNNTLHSNHKI